VCDQNRPSQFHTVSRAEFDRVRAALEAYHERIAALEQERQTDIKRMGAMQAEIDHLRAARDV
jgi:uncharacterized coiled-coil DUF342 family protein